MEFDHQAVVAEGGAKADRHAWSAAMKRASGEKVLDDPKLLKKTLKREEKRKQKSTDKWDKVIQLQVSAEMLRIIQPSAGFKSGLTDSQLGLCEC